VYKITRKVFGRKICWQLNQTFTDLNHIWT